MRDCNKFISKFGMLASEREKGSYNILETKAYPRKAKADRNIAITEHYIEKGHGKKHNKNWCMDCSTIWVSIKDLQRIIDYAKKATP